MSSGNSKSNGKIQNIPSRSSKGKVNNINVPPSTNPHTVDETQNIVTYSSVDRKLFEKTKLCRYLEVHRKKYELDNGIPLFSQEYLFVNPHPADASFICPRGARCHFAHKESEVKVAAESNMKICRPFVKFGRCRRGDSCPYMHPVPTSVPAHVIKVNVSLCSCSASNNNSRDSLHNHILPVGADTPIIDEGNGGSIAYFENDHRVVHHHHQNKSKVTDEVGTNGVELRNASYGQTNATDDLDARSKNASSIHTSNKNQKSKVSSIVNSTNGYYNNNSNIANVGVHGGSIIPTTATDSDPHAIDGRTTYLSGDSPVPHLLNLSPTTPSQVNIPNNENGIKMLDIKRIQSNIHSSENHRTAHSANVVSQSQKQEGHHPSLTSIEDSNILIPPDSSEMIDSSPQTDSQSPLAGSATYPILETSTSANAALEGSTLEKKEIQSKSAFVWTRSATDNNIVPVTTYNLPHLNQGQITSPEMIDNLMNDNHTDNAPVVHNIPLRNKRGSNSHNVNNANNYNHIHKTNNSFSTANLSDAHFSDYPFTCRICGACQLPPPANQSSVTLPSLSSPLTAASRSQKAPSSLSAEDKVEATRGPAKQTLKSSLNSTNSNVEGVNGVRTSYLNRESITCQNHACHQHHQASIYVRYPNTPSVYSSSSPPSSASNPNNNNNNNHIDYHRHQQQLHTFYENRSKIGRKIKMTNATVISPLASRAPNTTSANLNHHHHHTHSGSSSTSNKIDNLTHNDNVHHHHHHHHPAVASINQTSRTSPILSHQTSSRSLKTSSSSSRICVECISSSTPNSHSSSEPDAFDLIGRQIAAKLREYATSVFIGLDHNNNSQQNMKAFSTNENNGVWQKLSAEIMTTNLPLLGVRSSVMSPEHDRLQSSSFTGTHQQQQVDFDTPLTQQTPHLEDNNQENPPSKTSTSMLRTSTTIISPHPQAVRVGGPRVPKQHISQVEAQVRVIVPDVLVESARKLSSAPKRRRGAAQLNKQRNAVVLDKDSSSLSSSSSCSCSSSVSSSLSL